MPKHKRSSLKSALIFLVALAVLTAGAYLAWPYVTGGRPGGGPGLRGETSVRIGLRQAPASLDIRNEAGQEVEQALLGNVYETVTTPGDKGLPEPGLASKWDLSADRLTYTFHLRRGARFSDGSDLQSQDVLWSLEQTVKKKTPGYHGLDHLDQVTNPDPYTLVIHLSTPDAHLTRALYGRAGIVYNSRAGIDYSSSSAGSGPYTVGSWQSGRSLTLIRNKHYQGPHPAKSDKVAFSYGNSIGDQVRAVKEGRLDAAVDLTPTQADSARKTAAAGTGQALRVTTGSSRKNLVLIINNTPTSPFADQRCREIVRYAVDRTALADLQSGTAKPLNGPVNELSPAYDPSFNPFPHDPAKAASLNTYFTNRYYRGGVRLVYHESFGAQVGERIASDLGRVNIPVKTEMVDGTTYRDRMADGQAYELTLAMMDNEDNAVFADPASLARFDKPEVQQSYRALLDAADEDGYEAGLSRYDKDISAQSPCDWIYARTPVTLAAQGLEGMPGSAVDAYLPMWGVTA